MVLRPRDLVPQVMALSGSAVLHEGEEELLYQAQLRDGKFYRAHISYTGKGAVQFALLYHRRYMLVIFPGSKNPSDWVGNKGNLNATMKKRMGGWVHAGFWYQVDSYWGELEYYLASKRTPVVFAGHSRGGACAVLAALRFDEDSRLAAVLTFGQPTCVGRTHAKDIDYRWSGRYLRVATSSDIVPLLPPRPLYEHAGELIYLSADGRLIENPSRYDMKWQIARDNPMMRGLPSPVKMIKQGFQSLKGHGLRYYMNKLGNALLGDHPSRSPTPQTGYSARSRHGHRRIRWQ